LFRPQERAFKQFKCPRPQCVKQKTSAYEALYLDGGKVPTLVGWLSGVRTQTGDLSENSGA